MNNMLQISGALAASRVLIVDDDNDFADSIADVLEAKGFVVATAYDSAVALEKVDTFDPHVALIDLRLGSESGAELIERMRARRANLVCILMTAYAALDTAVQAVRKKADDYLLKPLQPQNVLEVIRDAVQRMRETALAERRERLERVGSVAAGVAHDLNNMLTVVIAEAEAIDLKSADADESVRAGLRLIRESTSRAAQITNNLLLVARGAPASAPCINPNEVLQETIRVVARTLPQAVTLDSDLAPDSDRPLTLAPSQLYQVVFNLLVNARDAVHASGSLLLRSRVSSPPPTLQALDPTRPAPTHCLVITVADNGIGMDARARKRIFEPFFTTKAHGSGLGLATAYGLVRACGGDISVESKPNVGTEFAVWLPLHELASAPELAALSPNAGSRPLAQHAGFLVCDDDPLVLQAIARMLRDMGYDVTQARGAEEALARWHEDPQRYATVITDMRLGERRGIDLAREILRERADVAVLLVSGDFSGRDVLDPVWKHVAHLQKPFDRVELTAALSRMRPSS
jgi:signal transduction histidine kinase